MPNDGAEEAVQAGSHEVLGRGIEGKVFSVVIVTNDCEPVQTLGQRSRFTDVKGDATNDDVDDAKSLSLQSLADVFSAWIFSTYLDTSHSANVSSRHQNRAEESRTVDSKIRN